MTTRPSVSTSVMAIDAVAPNEPSLVRFVTSYLEVEKQSISSLRARSGLSWHRSAAPRGRSARTAIKRGIALGED